MIFYYLDEQIMIKTYLFVDFERNISLHFKVLNKNLCRIKI